jgi:hypothetical protein
MLDAIRFLVALANRPHVTTGASRRAMYRDSGAVSPNVQLIDESLRGYVLLLSAHFQGFARDLYTECTEIIVSRVRASLQALIQAQFTARRKLDYGNPNLKNLRDDFERFGFILDLAGADPANALRLQDLAELNRWRNVAAHQGIASPLGVPLMLASIQTWRDSCDGLAASLDAIMYNQLRKILRRTPWT